MITSPTRIADELEPPKIWKICLSASMIIPGFWAFIFYSCWAYIWAAKENFCYMSAYLCCWAILLYPSTNLTFSGWSLGNPIIHPSTTASALNLLPYLDPALSNSLISFIASFWPTLESMALLALALISVMSKEGMTRLFKMDVMLFLDNDTLIESTILAISLLKFI